MNAERFSNYSGKLYIELETKYIFNDVDLVRELKNNSSRLINKGTCSRWEMMGLSEALKAVLMIQEKKHPFRLMGEGSILFIEQL